jgi:hypothetical protein
LTKLTAALLRGSTFVCFSVQHKKKRAEVWSVCLSVRMEELGSHWTDFRETWYLTTSRKSVDKFQV